MIRFFLVLNLLIGSVNFTNAQSIDSKNLMTIGGETISVKEFLRVYNKNIDLVQDDSQKNIDYYLNLYTNYKLKLKEARTLGFDQKESYKKEFESYKNQLSKAYTSDKEVTETLVKEAYNRTAKEVKAQHILVRIQPGQDTLAAYEKIQALRPRMVKEDFKSLRTALHDGKSIFVEDLGYFSAFKMVYDFENAAFNTPLGQTSKPFRTQFGYHVVKVLNKRPSKGKVQVAHIMIANTQNDSTLVPENRIKEIYRSIQEGDSFESLAKQFSDDKSSAAKGGVMNPFKSGDIRSEIFVNTAFGLKDIGAISEPIQTQFGWHILKLISKTPVEPYEKIKVDLEQKVKRDARSKIIRQKMLEKLKQQYKISQPSLESVVALIEINDADDTWMVEASIEPQVFLKIESQESGKIGLPAKLMVDTLKTFPEQPLTFIKTDKNYRNAKLIWEDTQEKIKHSLKLQELIVTQGFIGSDSNNFSTTLGREGSDYSAAIFAYCLNAKQVCVWKDVPGVLNADPLLNFPEFRAHERSFQMLSQVAGRSGRSKDQGRVLIQTFTPDHPVLTQVIHNDYEAFFNTQLKERKEYLYPPFYRLIRITLKAKDYHQVDQASQWLVNALNLSLQGSVLGPVVHELGY